MDTVLCAWQQSQYEKYPMVTFHTSNSSFDCNSISSLYHQLIGQFTVFDHSELEDIDHQATAFTHSPHCAYALQVKCGKVIA